MSLLDLLRRDLDRRDRERADIQKARYVRPLGHNALHELEPLGGGQRFVAKGAPKTTWRPGEILPAGSQLGENDKVILVGPPPGATGAARQEFRGVGQDSFAARRLDEIIPAAFDGGGTYAVSAFGAGFTASDTVRAVEWDGTTETYVDAPGYVVASVVFVDQGQIDFDLTVPNVSERFAIVVEPA